MFKPLRSPRSPVLEEAWEDRVWRAGCGEGAPGGQQGGAGDPSCYREGKSTHPILPGLSARQPASVCFSVRVSFDHTAPLGPLLEPIL